MSFSEKQMQILTFPYTSYTSLICDGAVRSGKTSVMSISFLLWAMGNFSGQNFGICGKTVISAERNVIRPLLGVKYLHEHFRLKFANHILTVSRGNKTNTFYVFGGKDESSYMLIQGVTLAGVLLDEVALMPESFVNQALARCSVEGSKYWFNCNPEGPQHWFYQEWVLQPEKHNALHLHFLLDDNPSLSEAKKQEYYSSYSGVFYDRYILGLWTMAEGRIYDFFRRETYVRPAPETCDAWYISMDYGTQNPTAMLLWGRCGGNWYAVGEYYYSGRSAQAQKTDEEYYRELERLADGRPIQAVVIDPSAASFIACIKRHGKYRVYQADNGVLDGIRNTATALQSGKVNLTDRCPDTLREIESYVWDAKAAQRGEDKPLKENDHGCDSLRYFVQTIIARPKARVTDRRRLGIY